MAAATDDALVAGTGVKDDDRVSVIVCIVTACPYPPALPTVISTDATSETFTGAVHVVEYVDALPPPRVCSDAPFEHVARSYPASAPTVPLVACTNTPLCKPLSASARVSPAPYVDADDVTTFVPVMTFTPMILVLRAMSSPAATVRSHLTLLGCARARSTSAARHRSVRARRRARMVLAREAPNADVITRRARVMARASRNRARATLVCLLGALALDAPLASARATRERVDLRSRLEAASCVEILTQRAVSCANGLASACASGGSVDDVARAVKAAAMTCASDAKGALATCASDATACEDALVGVADKCERDAVVVVRKCESGEFDAQTCEGELEDLGNACAAGIITEAAKCASELRRVDDDPDDCEAERKALEQKCHDEYDEIKRQIADGDISFLDGMKKLAEIGKQCAKEALALRKKCHPDGPPIVADAVFSA